MRISILTSFPVLKPLLDAFDSGTSPFSCSNILIFRPVNVESQCRISYIYPFSDKNIVSVLPSKSFTHFSGLSCLQSWTNTCLPASSLCQNPSL